MATLATIRGRLNLELGVTVDATDSAFSQASRSQAVSDGYAALWRAGVWKDAKQDLATVTDQWIYALTSIRALDRLEVLDSSSRVLEQPRGVVEQDDSGSNLYQVRLIAPLAAGYTLRVRGWSAYKSVFANDADTDDLPVEHIRIPLLKAKAICYRNAMGTYARFAERQSLPPEMNLSVDQFVGLIASVEREFEAEAARLARLRRRTGQQRRI